MTAKNTRRKILYLIRFESTKLNEKKLPNNRDVLSLFMYKHNSEKWMIRQSASYVANILISIWNKFQIPIIQTRNNIRTLEKLYGAYQKIKTNKLRKNQSAKEQKKKQILRANWMNCMKLLVTML